MIEASCHCGSVRLEVDDTPETVTDCNCSLCRRLGGLWAYYHPDQVRRVAGETVAYVQGDRTTHWHSLDANYERMATPG